jgi:hypothetical protein
MKTRVVNRRKEPFDVYIGRPSPWGNPFSHVSHMGGTLAKFNVANRAEAIARFREWFLAQPELVERARRELRGKVLGCWCKPATCHGDVIAEIVDGAEGSMLGKYDWTKIGATLRESALSAHGGELPSVETAYGFLLDNPECFGELEAWPDDMPQRPNAEVMAAYYGPPGVEQPGLFGPDV